VVKNRSGIYLYSKNISNMSHKEIIDQKGYIVFDLTRETDSDSATPVESKYSAIVLCTQGEATLDANMTSCHMQKGDFFCVANILYKRTTSMSEDFKARVLICLNSFAYDSSVGIPMGFMESIYNRRSINIDNETVINMLSNYFDNLEQLQCINLGTHHKDLVILTFRSIMIFLSMMLGDHNNNSKGVYGQGDVYFRKFIELIDSQVKKNHEVSHYAEQLHITPKYLSEVCKLKSGHKAKEIISSFLISRIKQEIVMTRKSIKAIAYEYGFADQSSMGKFFSKMTGQSPGEFRRSSIGSKD